MTTNPGYIYLINAENTDLYKIGLTTRNPHERLKELNGKQSPYNLVLTHCIKVLDVRGAERHLHKACEDYHHHNEWFKFPSDITPLVIKEMNNYKVNHQPKTTTQTAPAQPTYYHRNYDDDTNTIQVIAVVAFILMALSQCGEKLNPKYQACINNQGGNACQTILKNK